jgi:hypothetical protein
VVEKCQQMKVEGRPKTCAVYSEEDGSGMYVIW